MACSAELFPIWTFFSFTDHFTFYWPHFLCRFAYTALDSESLEERPVSTLLSAIKARLLARKYQQLWDGNTRSSDMEILETLKYWQLELLGIWGTNMRRVCAGHSIFTQAIQWRIPPRMWPVTIVDKMFCELDTCVTLTKNNIGSSEDSYREGLARGKFMQMKQEIQFVCVNKYPLALCEENHLLKM